MCKCVIKFYLKLHINPSQGISSNSVLGAFSSGLYHSADAAAGSSNDRQRQLPFECIVWACGRKHRRRQQNRRLCIIHKTYTALASIVIGERTQVVSRDYFQIDRTQWVRSPNDHAWDHSVPPGRPRCCPACTDIGASPCVGTRESPSKFMRRIDARTAARFIRHTVHLESRPINDRFRAGITH